MHGFFVCSHVWFLPQFFSVLSFVWNLHNGTFAPSYVGWWYLLVIYFGAYRTNERRQIFIAYDNNFINFGAMHLFRVTNFLTQVVWVKKRRPESALNYTIEMEIYVTYNRRTVENVFITSTHASHSKDTVNAFMAEEGNDFSTIFSLIISGFSLPTFFLFFWYWRQNEWKHKFLIYYLIRTT